MLFNDALSCWDYIASVTDVWMMSTEHRFNDTDTGKTKVFGGKPIPIPLCSPQIPLGLNVGVRGKRRAWPMARPQQIIKPLQNRLLSHIARPKYLQKCTALFRPVSFCALICTVPKHRPLWCQPVWELQVGLTYLNLRCRCWMIWLKLNIWKKGWSFV